MARSSTHFANASLGWWRDDMNLLCECFTSDKMLTVFWLSPQTAHEVWCAA